jgi:hypothetical protein
LGLAALAAGVDEKTAAGAVVDRCGWAYVRAEALEGGVLAPDMQRRCGLGNLAEEAAARSEKLIEVLKGDFRRDLDGRIRIGAPAVA